MYVNPLAFGIAIGIISTLAIGLIGFIYLGIREGKNKEEKE